MQVIAERNAHVGLVGAVLADRDARRKAHLGKVPVTIVLEKRIRAGIVGDEQIEGMSALQGTEVMELAASDVMAMSSPAAAPYQKALRQRGFPVLRPASPSSSQTARGESTAEPIISRWVGPHIVTSTP